MSDPLHLAERLAGMRATAEPYPNPWQRTMELRFNRGVLEQCWRSPDGREDWRAVPSVVYAEAPPAGG